MPTAHRLLGGAQRRALRAFQLLRHRYVDDFVFVHINKTGGSSVEKAFGLALDHRTALEKIEHLGRAEWDRRLTFTVVRNPWDKVVSHYHYRMQRPKSYLKHHPIPFAEWVARAYRDHDPLYYEGSRMFNPQAEWLCDADGTLLVDVVCRFERLAADVEAVGQRLGRTVSLPHEKPSRRGPYQGYYDAATCALVADLFARDVELFGYTFEPEPVPQVV